MTEMVTAPRPRATRMPQPRPDNAPGPARIEMILGRAGIRLPIS
jgi:hypothetical protein